MALEKIAVRIPITFVFDVCVNEVKYLPTVGNIRNVLSQSVASLRFTKDLPWRIRFNRVWQAEYDEVEVRSLFKSEEDNLEQDIKTSEAKVKQMTELIDEIGKVTSEWSDDAVPRLKEIMEEVKKDRWQFDALRNEISQLKQDILDAQIELAQLESKAKEYAQQVVSEDNEQQEVEAVESRVSDIASTLRKLSGKWHHQTSKVHPSQSTD